MHNCRSNTEQGQEQTRKDTTNAVSGGEIGKGLWKNGMLAISYYWCHNFRRILLMESVFVLVDANQDFLGCPKAQRYQWRVYTSLLTAKTRALPDDEVLSSSYYKTRPNRLVNHSQ
jgi:hypothetical protein